MNRSQLNSFLVNPKIKNLVKVEDIIELPEKLFEGWNVDRRSYSVEDIYTTAIAFNRNDILLNVLAIVGKVTNKYDSIYFANRIARCAALYGRREMVDYMIKNGANDYDWIACGAAEGGHKELLSHLIEEDADDWEMIAGGAALGNQKAIVDDMFERGIDDPNSIIGYAAQGGHKELLDYLVDKYGDGKGGETIAYGAAEGGHLAILKNYIDLDHLDYDMLITNAVENGHMEVASFVAKNRECPNIIDDYLRQ